MYEFCPDPVKYQCKKYRTLYLKKIQIHYAVVRSIFVLQQKIYSNCNYCSKVSYFLNSTQCHYY